jgi:hypothetical protein
MHMDMPILECGRVYLLYLLFIQPQPKDKFCILACQNTDKHYLLLINSEIHPFKAKHPDHAAAQIVIDAERHDFLIKDSFVDCSDPCSINNEWLIDQIMADNKRIKGVVHPEVINSIREAIGNCRLLSPIKKEAMLTGLPIF